jgi:hypothetical protein
MEGDGLVVEMNTFNADTFFSDEERAVKAVLFTRKAEVPPLWRQVAMANLRIASFGLVRHSEDDLMERFGLTPELLPRVMVFLPGWLPLRSAGPVSSAPSLHAAVDIVPSVSNHPPVFLPPT